MAINRWRIVFARASGSFNLWVFSAFLGSFLHFYTNIQTKHFLYIITWFLAINRWRIVFARASGSFNFLSFSSSSAKNCATQHDQGKSKSSLLSSSSWSGCGWWCWISAWKKIWRFFKRLIASIPTQKWQSSIWACSSIMFFWQPYDLTFSTVFFTLTTLFTRPCQTFWWQV